MVALLTRESIAINWFVLIPSRFRFQWNTYLNTLSWSFLYRLPVVVVIDNDLTGDH